MSQFDIRVAQEEDVALILQFIKELAQYEQLLDEVEATEDLLHKWLFAEKKAEVLIGYQKEVPVGFALFFYNFSTFVGKAGIYIEDIFVQQAYRGKGLGKQFFKTIAQKALENDCGRMEWCCLNWNQSSIDFYLWLGAQPMKQWTTYRLNRKDILFVSKL